MGLFDFGKPKPPPTPAGQKILNAIQKMDDTIGLLERKKDNYEKRRMKLIKDSKSLKRREDKIRAAKNLKQLRKHEERLQGQIDNLESQRYSLENAQQMKIVVETMEQGQSAMRDAGLNLEDLEERMDDIRDNMQMMEDISDALSQPMGVGEVYDDDELLAELEEETAIFDEEEADDVMAQLDLNDVPTTEPAIDTEDDFEVAAAPRAVKPKKKREEQELAELTGW